MKLLFSDNSLRSLLIFRGKVMEDLLNDGHTIVAVAPKCDQTMLPEFPKEIEVIEVDMDVKGKNPLNDLKYYKRLKSIYKDVNPDYIFHFTIKPNIYGTLAAKSLKIPTAAVIAGLGHAYSQGGIGNAIARMMYKYAMRYPCKVLTLNQENHDKLLNHNIVSQDKLMLLPGGEGVDLSDFPPMQMPTSEKPVFLMLARVQYEKGYTEFVEAGESLKGVAEFRLMGMIDTHTSAVALQTIEQDVAKGAIQYLGFSPDVKTQIEAAHCIVLPSYHEGLSRVLMEALACGRPIITTDIAGCKETVDEGVNGFLIPPKNGKALADACLRFTKLTQEQKLSMAQAARQKAEVQFDITHVVDIYKSIIEKI